MADLALALCAGLVATANLLRILKVLARRGDHLHLDIALAKVFTRRRIVDGTIQ